MPTATARSSMADSRAKLLAVDARARYEPCRSGESEPWNSIDLVRHDSYGVRDGRAAGVVVVELPGRQRAVLGDAGR